MHRLLVGVVGALCVAGCSLDLALPPVNQVSIELGGSLVAPRERLALEAKGGAPPYRFSFAPGSPASGEGATLSEAGEYQAGARGLAQDLVRVSDASGAVAEARLNVGPPLAITPALSAIAPGGRVTFTASGGKPPYVFSLPDGGTLPGGEYDAPPPGDRVESITLTDATGDALAAARALVSIGTSLVIYPGTAAVAPRETLLFVGLGGQSSYRFALAPDAGSDGASPATIDATGRYQAGSGEGRTGPSVDRVVITDRNGATATADVTVGPSLQAISPLSAVRPGEPLTLAASGGKPPYRYDWAPRGDRSDGNVDEAAGLYTPGLNSGAVDLLQVTDATGSTAAFSPLVVGPLTLRVPRGGGTQLLPADFDGDGDGDLAVLDEPSGALTTFLRPGRASQLLVQQSLEPSTVLAGVGPIGGSFATDLVQLTPTALEVSFGGSSGLQAPQRRWTFPQVPFARASFSRGVLTRWSTGPTPCIGLVVQGLSLAGLQEPLCLEASPATPFALGASHLDASSVFFSLPDPAGSTTWSASVPGPLELRYVNFSSFTVVRSAQLPLPAGTRVGRSSSSAVGGANQVLDDATVVGGGRALVLLQNTDGGSNLLWGVDLLGPSSAWGPARLDTPAPARGIAAMQERDGAPLVAAWDHLTGVVPLVSVQPDGGSALRQRLALPDPVTVAAFGDLDADGTPDLAVGSEARGQVQVLWGEGGGVFGTRARFRGFGKVRPETADVDRDGRTDVVSVERDVVGVSWAVDAGGQLAVGPRSALGVVPVQLMVDDFTARGEADLLLADERGGLHVAPGSQGHFGAPQPLVTVDGTPAIGSVAYWSRAELGGAAAGPDVISTVVEGGRTVHFELAVRLAGSTARRLPLPMPRAQCILTPAAADVDGTGVDDLVTVCLDGTRFDAWVAPSSGAGATLSVGAWSLLPGGPIAGQPFLLARGSPTGPLQLLTTETVYRLARINGAFTLVAEPLPAGTILNGGWLGRVSASGARPDLIVAEPGSETIGVYAWSGSSWVRRQVLPLRWQSGLFFLERTPQGAADVLLRDLGGSATLLVNDGLGTLR